MSLSKLVTAGGGLTGLVTDVQVFSSVLSEEDAVRYMDCSGEITGDVAAWEREDDWEMVGNIEIGEKVLETICTQGAMEDRVFIIPARLDYKGIHSLDFDNQYQIKRISFSCIYIICKLINHL